MNHQLRPLLLAACLACASNVAAAELWSDAPTPKRAGSIAHVERWVALDGAVLDTALATVDVKAGGQVVELPLPFGGQQRFVLQPTRVMAPELAARFPQIRTYAGVGLDDPLARVRLELTPDGLSAMIFGAEGVSMIRPEARKGLYRVFQRETVRSRSQLQCDAHPQVPTVSLYGMQPHAKSVATGLRQYRTAIATTNEYTAYFGGTKDDGMAAIAAALNRVNGVFENEVGVTFQLVGGNADIVFDDATPDSFADDDADQLIDQVQTVIDNVIGSANYDIGHVFSTGGGGLAATGPCIEGGKANGVTGSSNPTNDPFWIDYVAHEIGHQLSANHTFNDDALGACAGNRAAEAAFEPGSGSTIMAYAGICSDGSSDVNLQLQSDPYFHVGSLAEMHAYTQDGSAGGSCGTFVPNNANTAPAISATAPSAGGAVDAVIPARTPFFLSATASDSEQADGTLTYSWEQIDAGSAALADDGSNAIIRSYLPSTSSIRYVPRLSDLLAGTSTFGEALPSTSRMLNFRVTVRDNRLGGGGASWSGENGQATDVALQVVDSGVPFRVTSHAAAATLTAGSGTTVQWDVAGTTAAPVSCANVSIGWSSDGGTTFGNEASFPNTGSASVTVPPLAGAAVRIRVRCASSPFFNVNAANLTIGADPTAIFRDGFEG